jgi:hypothetical protein
MGKKLDLSYDIDAPVEAVYAAISGEDWAQHRAEHFGDDSRLESRTASGDAVTMVVSRGLPDGIPGFLEKFLPAGGRAKQTEAWGAAEADGTRRGTWTGEIPGAPAKTGGTMALEPTGTGTRYRIQGEVKVSIPLVGGKAESFVADMIGKLTAKEAELLERVAGSA